MISGQWFQRKRLKKWKNCTKLPIIPSNITNLVGVHNHTETFQI